MNLNYKLLGKRIKELRVKINLTQEALAEKIDVSPVYISHIEVGSSIPSLETLLKICNELETTPDYILLDSIHSSKEYLRDDIAILLKSCSVKDMQLIIKIIEAMIQNNADFK
jgi:HTH-type transcriptional regulator, cell division transcriptional repressor